MTDKEKADLYAILTDVRNDIKELRAAVEYNRLPRYYYTFDEACQILRLKRTALSERINSGAINWTIKKGKKILFPKNKLEQYAAGII